MRFIGFFVLSTVVFSVENYQQHRNFKNSNLYLNESHVILTINESKVDFFAIGDWGGGGIISRTPAQHSVSIRMEKIGSIQNTKFQLGLGDNFYFYGVKNVKDNRFKNTFEDVYNEEHLKNTPWFHVLGNHDHYGNTQAQIDYTAKSNRWIMPNFNYTIDVMSKDGQHKLMSILMIDTIKLCGNTDFTLNPFKSVDDKTPSFSSVREQMMAKLNLIDLENKLKTISSSNVTYILVGGHFPVYSIASHGSTQCLIDNIMPLLHKYRVSAYLSGHDHNLQHISHTFLNATVEYMVTGANSVNTNSLKHLQTIPADSLKFRWPSNKEIILGGFLMIEASDSNMTVNFIKANGDILYQKVIEPREMN